MDDNKKRQMPKDKLIFIVSFVLASIIVISLLSSIIQLAIKPTNSFMVENRKNIPRRNNLWIYSKRRKSFAR